MEINLTYNQLEQAYLSIRKFLYQLIYIITKACMQKVNIKSILHHSKVISLTLNCLKSWLIINIKILMIARNNKIYTFIIWDWVILPDSAERDFMKFDYSLFFFQHRDFVIFLQHMYYFVIVEYLRRILWFNGVSGIWWMWCSGEVCTSPVCLLGPYFFFLI